MLSNAYFLAKFRFDTAENEPAKNLAKFSKNTFSKNAFAFFENVFFENAFFENAFFENTNLGEGRVEGAEDEELVVPQADAVADPRAVVVVPKNACVAWHNYCGKIRLEAEGGLSGGNQTTSYFSIQFCEV